MFTVISIDMYEARVLSRKKTMKVKTFFCSMAFGRITETMVKIYTAKK